MSSTTPLPVPRRRRSRSEVLELIHSFEQSGQNLPEYCCQHGLSKSAMSSLLRRHGHSSMVSKTAAVNEHTCSKSTLVGFAPVEFVAALPFNPAVQGSTLIVEMLGGVRVHLERNFDEITFRRLLAVLNKA